MLTALFSALFTLLLSGQSGSAPATDADPAVVPPAAPPTRITVLFDNHAVGPDLHAAHGFACLVEGFEQTILFDTGASGSLLVANMEALGIDASTIDAVVLSHQHSDHTGGLSAVLARDPGVPVYFPDSFSRSFARSVAGAGGTARPVEGALMICPRVTVTAPAGSSPAESALLLETASGPVLITGCAHPGIVAMAEAASAYAGEPLHAVMGGFHLSGTSKTRVAAIVADLLDLGVERCGPAHCTGDAATAQFEKAFATGFIPMAVGVVVEF